MLLYAHTLHEQLKQQKSARIFSQSRLLTPTLILWIRMMVGSGRKKRKEEKKKDRPYLLLDMGQGPYVVGSQKRRKAARKRPHRCYIHIHQIKSHISTRFFLVQMAPRLLNLPTGYLDTYLCPSNQFPVPSTQSWLMHAFLHLFSLPSSIPASSVLHSPNIHG